MPSAADVSAVRRASPLAADHTMRCGPFDVPVAAMASPTSLETEDAEEAHATRRFVEDDPWAGMGSVHAGGWMLLARDPNTIVIGQRHGEVGLGKVVVLERRGNGFQALSMGGWRLSSPDPREDVEASFTATVQGTRVIVHWDCGRDLGGVVVRVVSRCDVLETDTDVHFLLFSIRNPALPAVLSGFDAGTGASATATFELSKPLGSRGLFNDFRVPAHQMAIGVRDG